jgi:hypothetical protein
LNGCCSLVVVVAEGIGGIALVKQEAVFRPVHKVMANGVVMHTNAVVLRENEKCIVIYIKEKGKKNDYL